jgi:DNA-binding CsgD family transcriptional regulator
MARQHALGGQAMSDDQEADRAAIIAAIEQECAAYLAKDFDRFASYWVHEPYVRRFLWHADVGMMLIEGWDAESAMQSEAMRRFPQPISDDVVRDWQVMLIDRDMAYVVFNQYSAQAGDPCQITGMQHEMRVMIRREGRWLIAAVSNLKPWSEIAQCPVVRVDNRGRVLWRNPQAVARLERHPGLIISGGHLRARSRSTDHALQLAIAWAAEGLTYARKRASQMQRADTGGAVPVLDESATDRPLVLCWVVPSDGMVLVTLDDQDTFDHRIAAAGAVFRLSPTQLRLVRLLLAGQDLASASTEMAISVSTVRTQLRRIFDKTGVHNQAALLRLMLSVVPPH